MTAGETMSFLEFYTKHAVEVNGVKFIPLAAACQEIGWLQAVATAAHAAGRAEGLEAADKAVEAARDGLRDAGWGAGADVALSAIRALK